MVISMGNNHTLVTELLLTALTELPHMQITLFVLFFVAYALTLLGNLGVILLIKFSNHLHTPMYFFLSNLSFLDICYSSAVTPKLLTDLLNEKKIITLAGCFTQLYFYGMFASTESCILAVMAYDRYVAICKPLLYLVTMSPQKCVKLVLVSYLVGIVHISVHVGVASRLSFCGPNVIKNVYCDGPSLFDLSCSDFSLNDTIMFVLIGFNIITTSLIILLSYTYIVFSIVKFHSAKSWQKAFYTCSSHLIVVLIFYGCACFMYTRPSSRTVHIQDKIASLFFVVVIPMLNPLIYSLRNQEVRSSFRKVLGRKASF